MSFLRCASFALCSALLLSPAAPGQNLQSFLLGISGFNSPQEGHVVGSAQVQVPPNPLKVVVGAPFSAEETRRITVVRPDGSSGAAPFAPHKLYRDSLGRTRIEQPVAAADGSRMVAEVNDPGAGVYYLLDLARKIAHRVKYALPPLPGPNAKQRTRAMPTVSTSLITPGGPAGTPVPVTEALGTREIQGVQAQGKRSTVTMAVNPARTTDTISRVTDTWYSPELEITLLTTVTDARSGDSKVEIVNLSRQEPAAGLFEVPADFEIVDQPQFFAVDFK
jgi:hypothetical protein